MNPSIQVVSGVVPHPAVQQQRQRKGAKGNNAESGCNRRRQQPKLISKTGTAIRKKTGSKDVSAVRRKKQQQWQQHEPKSLTANKYSEEHTTTNSSTSLPDSSGSIDSNLQLLVIPAHSDSGECSSHNNNNNNDVMMIRTSKKKQQQQHNNTMTMMMMMEVIEPWLESSSSSPTTHPHHREAEAPIAATATAPALSSMGVAFLPKVTLCSALDMLSFDTLCGGRMGCAVVGDTTAATPHRGLTLESISGSVNAVLFNTNTNLRAEKPENSIIVHDSSAAWMVGNPPLVGESSGIPREISFEQKDSSWNQRRKNTMDSSSSSIHREEMKMMDFYDPPTAAVSLFRSFLGGNKSERMMMRGQKKKTTTTTCTKVKIYCETPIPLEHTDSLANSTITWPRELKQNDDNWNVVDEHQL
jgi:hypothetical protein